MEETCAVVLSDYLFLVRGKAMLGMDCSSSCNPSVVCLNMTYLARMVMCVPCALVGCVKGFEALQTFAVMWLQVDAVKLICCMGAH